MRILLPGLILATLLSACGGQNSPVNDLNTGDPAQSEGADMVTVTAVPDAAATARSVGRTYGLADGNRLVTGAADLAALTPLDISLADAPLWVVAAPYGNGLLWAVVLPGGVTQAFSVRDGNVTPVALMPSRLPDGAPPLLIVEDERAYLLQPAGDLAPLTHPVLINDAGDLAFLDRAGQLNLQIDGMTTTLVVNALPDARLLVDERGRILLLTAPTDVYDHGVLGDTFEAGAITLVATTPAPAIVTVIPIEPPHVVEGIAPIWVDWDGDGAREIIVTRSSPGAGAQLVVYSESGALIATGDAIGRGGRWRHQLAVAPFAADGVLELVDVLTPHIGGVAEFFRWEGDRLVETAGFSGYTSHRIRTRNLDMAVAGDIDASGVVSLLLPVQDRTELGAIQQQGGVATVAFSLPLAGELVTNLAAAPFGDGLVGVGAGRADGVLRIWQPAGSS